MALLAALAVVPAAGGLQAPDTGSEAPPPSAAETGASPPDTAPPSPETVERLAGLARLWGKVKYFHPYLGYREIDWDRALVETIPRVEAADGAEEYQAAVDHLLAFLDDPQTRTQAAGGGEGELVAALVRPRATRPAGITAGPAGPEAVLAVISGAGEEDAVDGEEEPAADEAATAEEPAATGEAEAATAPALEWLDGGIAWIDAQDRAALLATGRWSGGVFTEAFEEAREGAGIVLDLRGGAGEADYRAAFFLTGTLQADLSALLAEDVLLPALRTRMHSGYPTQTGGSSGGYSSGFAVGEHAVIPGEWEGGNRVPWVVLSDDGVSWLWDILAGLQAAGVATVVHQGEGTAFVAPGGSVAVALPDDVTVRMRAAEAVLPGGAVGFRPAFLLDPPGEENSGGGGEGDPARELALAVVRGERTPERSGAPALPARRLREEPYPEMSYPSRPYRLLALFRFWNVIEYFFPYKELMDRSWEEALPELIPRFATAGDEEAYHLVVAEMVAGIQDSHGSVASDVLQRYFGAAAPPLEQRLIEERWVVTAVRDDELADSGTVAVGDVILAVDGEPVEEKVERLSRYIAHSTPQALARAVSWRLLAGPEDSEARVLLERGDGAAREVSLRRGGWDAAAVRRRREEERLPVYTVLPEGYGYFDLTRLERSQVPEAFAAVRETPALILDMRGYPRGTAWTITPYLAAESATAARFRRRMYVDASDHATSDYTFEQPFPAGGPWQYAGRLVVLIDERAISQSEHSCLFFESARPDVTFIGSPTNGANGDVTATLLPGGIRAAFSGHDVRHADGRRLQRVGIQPDVPAAPTVAGVREGRDEVLEAALAFLAAGDDGAAAAAGDGKPGKVRSSAAGAPAGW